MDDDDDDDEGKEGKKESGKNSRKDCRVFCSFSRGKKTSLVTFLDFFQEENSSKKDLISIIFFLSSFFANYHLISSLAVFAKMVNGRCF